MRRPRILLAAAVVLAVAGAVVPPARAAGPRILLDRAEIEPSSFGGLARVRLYVSAVQLEGALIDVGAADPFVLLVNGARRREPYLSGRFSGAGAAAAVVIVVETGWEMRDDLDAIREAIDEVVSSAPPGTQVAIMSYGESVDGGHKLSPATVAGKAVDELEADPAPADPQLLDAIERAIETLSRTGGEKRPKGAKGGDDEDEPPPARRLVIVVSDGKDIDQEPERFREVGERAEHEGVRIHSLAYSPVDNRRPLLGLGELSKRSGGTFRWVRSRDGFRGQVETLVAEIHDQYVLTWFLPPDQVVGKRLAISYLDLTSNELKVKKVACGGRACGGGEVCARAHCVVWGKGGGGGVLRWVLWIGGGLIGFVLLAGVTGAAVGKLRARRGRPRQRVAPVAPGLPAPPTSPAMAPVVPPRATGGLPAQPFPVAAAAGAPVLLILQGPYQGQRFPLRHGFLVGSARGCDLTLPDPQVAPHHAIFMMDTSGTWAILDRGSASGIFVNGVRIAEARLQHGNVVRIGGCEIRYLGQ